MNGRDRAASRVATVTGACRQTTGTRSRDPAHDDIVAVRLDGSPVLLWWARCGSVPVLCGSVSHRAGSARTAPVQLGRHGWQPRQGQASTLLSSTQRNHQSRLYSSAGSRATWYSTVPGPRPASSAPTFPSSPVIATLSAETVAVNRLMPAWQARSDRRASSSVPSPRPCQAQLRLGLRVLVPQEPHLTGPGAQPGEAVREQRSVDAADLADQHR